MVEQKVYKKSPAWKSCPVCGKYIPFNWTRHVKCSWNITKKPRTPIFKTALEIKVDDIAKECEKLGYRLNVYRDLITVLAKKISRLADEIKESENKVDDNAVEKTKKTV